MWRDDFAVRTAAVRRSSLANLRHVRNHDCGTGTHRSGVWKPLQTDVRLLAHLNPYAFAVGEPATYVQAPKAKGRRSRRFDGFSNSPIMGL